MHGESAIREAQARLDCLNTIAYTLPKSIAMWWRRLQTVCGRGTILYAKRVVSKFALEAHRKSQCLVSSEVG